jgi:hypothetical protein
MTRTQRQNLIAAGAIAAILAGCFAYTTHQERELTRSIVALVTDSSARLQSAIAIESDGPTAESAANQEKLNEHTAAADLHYDTLRGLHAAPVWPLADAADDYVHGAREIIRRKAASHRYQFEMAASLQSLRDHMRADNRTGPWVTAAIRAKQRLEKDYRDYRLATEALVKLLDAYAASRAKLSVQLASVPLLEGSAAEQARTRAVAELGRAAAEAGQVGRLAAYR